MFRVLAGRTVYLAETATQMLIMAATRKPQPLREVLPDIPEPIVSVVDRGLEVERDRRWATAAEMQAALCANWPGGMRPSGAHCVLNSLF
jgi:hypothetical protein